MGKKHYVLKSRKHSLPNNLVSFFRKGKLKKFLLASNKGTEERTFLEAITLMECKENETKLKLPKEYFDLLSKKTTGLLCFTKQN